MSTLKLKNCGFPIQAKNYKLIVYYDVSLCVDNTDGLANRTIFLLGLQQEFTQHSSKGDDVKQAIANQKM